MDDLRSGPRLQSTGLKTGFSAWAAFFIFLFITSSATAYFQAFGAMKPFDDEGGLISLLRSCMQGGSLYNSVQTIYGPAFFLYEWLAHLLLGDLPSNDSVRFVSIFFRVLVAFLAFFVVRRATRSWALALLAHVLIFRLAKVLGEEPAHPQELCIFMVLAVVAIGYTRWPGAARCFCLGAIAAAMVLTKINAGAMILVVLGLALTFAARPTGPVRLLRGLCALGALLFIGILMGPNLGAGWAQRYLILGECSLGAVLIIIWGTESDLGLEWWELLVAAAGFGVMAAAILLFATVHGASLGSMFRWLVIVPRQVIGGSAWSLHLNMPNWYIGFAGAGLLCSLLARTGRATAEQLAVLKLAVGMGVVAMAGASRFGALLCLTPPWLWLLAVPRQDGSPRGSFARSLGALTASLFLLYAFPVAGGQVRLADAPLTVAGMLILADGLDYATSRWHTIPAWLPSMAGPAALALGLAISLFSVVRARNAFAKLEPLNLRGAHRLRLPAEDVSALRALSAGAESSCGMLVTAPGMPSFNLWTGLPSMAALGAGNWVTGMPDSDQIQVVRELTAKQRLCFIYSDAMVHFWTHTHDVGDRPIIRYMRQNFRTVIDRQGYLLMVPELEISR